MATIQTINNGDSGAVARGKINANDSALNAVLVGDSGAGGTKGLVPAPGAGDSGKYLKGDGTWSINSKAIGYELVSPSSSEDFGHQHVDSAITITKMVTVLSGSATPSVTWTIRHGTDRSAVGTEVVTGGTTTTSVTSGSQVTIFNNASVATNSFLWIETTAQSGTVDGLGVTIHYTVD